MVATPIVIAQYALFALFPARLGTRLISQLCMPARSLLTRGHCGHGVAVRVAELPGCGRLSPGCEREGRLSGDAGRLGLSASMMMLRSRTLITTLR